MKVPVDKLLLMMILGAMLVGAGCTARHYRKSADKEVARIIAAKSRAVTNMDLKFTIETNPPPSLQGLPVKTQPEEFFGTNVNGKIDDLEIGAAIITLSQALDLAVKHSRTYQNRKELLYLQALDLTLARHQYTPIFSGNVRSEYTSAQVETGIDELTEERGFITSGNLGMDTLLRSGGRIAADFTSDFLQFISGRPHESRLLATFTQPLLRGAGYQIALENLTQAERNLLYALREFTIYRKDFSVGIASEYYDVLRNRDAVRNSWYSFQAFKQNVARSRALADEGRLAQSDLDRLQQAELTTETGWINAKRTYRQNLDRFKISLGLPTDAQLVLDDRELANLKVIHPRITSEQAIQVALSNRLDLYTQREKVEDAERNVKVARNALLPDLDLFASVTVPGVPRTGFSEPDYRRYSWSAGLDLDLPLNRKAERNSYRSALIDLGRTGREWELAVDNVKLQINDDWRGLDQARRNYQNAELGVKLNQRRVEEQELRAELGLGKALDLVDAQNALLSSQNELTDALVKHSIARLRFWRNMGILIIRDDGRWRDLTDVTQN